jgi:hypothetical protein
MAECGCSEKHCNGLFAGDENCSCPNEGALNSLGLTEQQFTWLCVNVFGFDDVAKLPEVE